MAVDSFFEDSSRKRKRGGVGNKRYPNQTNGGSRGGSANGRGRGGGLKGKGRQRDEDEQLGLRIDEDLGGSDSGSSEDDFIEGDDDVNLQDYNSEEEQDARETAAQKRLRLAKTYLESLKSSQAENAGIDAAELEREYIESRLQKDVLEVSGKLHLRIANQYKSTIPKTFYTSNKAHRQSLTCSVASDDCMHLFTASKDGSLARWNISDLNKASAEASTSTLPAPAQSLIRKTDFIPKRPSLGKKQASKNDSKGKAAIARNQPSQDEETHGHTDEIYTLSISSDGKRLASAGKDRRIGVWDISNNTQGQGCMWLKGLRGHKDSIASIKFRLGTSQLYTSSFDRTLKIYDVGSLTYIETLFGHQDKIHDMSVLKNELAVSTGGRDKTLRYWKIRDESQLVFRAGGISKIRKVLEGGLDEDDEDIKARKKAEQNGLEKRFVEGSVDCTAMIDDQHFLSGGDSGTISLWNTTKKKPIFSIPVAHGVNEYHSETEGIIGNPRWIVSLATLPYSDLFASGSWDGKIRLWKISEDLKSFSPLTEFDALGCVNSLQLLQLPVASTQGKKKAIKETAGVAVVASLAQEHKFGRWIRIEKAKNVAMVALLKSEWA